jgi:hypothetical protein
MYSIAAKEVDSRLADFVLWKFADEIGVMSVIGKAEGHIGLAAAELEAKGVTLYESGVSRRSEAEHYLAHGYDFCHMSCVLGL